MCIRDRDHGGFQDGEHDLEEDLDGVAAVDHGRFLNLHGLSLIHILSGSKLYGELTSDSFALKDGDAVTSIAYVIETYGIIYNLSLIHI